MATDFIDAFLERLEKAEPYHNQKDREIRESLSEAQVDEMVAGSFPASDPPSTY